ncbi:MAG: hypothetical protein RR139_11390 [Lachnospiraceae bacterium]
MEQNMVFIVIFGAIALVGATEVIYQIYKIAIVDAKARGLKNPKLWGLLAMGGNNSSGLLLYLIGRRNHPILNMSDEDRILIEKRKKSAGVGIVFLAIASIGFIIFISRMLS